MSRKNVKDNSLGQKVQEICTRELRRRDLTKLARDHRWKLRSAGKEAFVAYQEGYNNITIPGHSEHSLISAGLAQKIVKSLLEPSFEREISENIIKDLNIRVEDLEAALRHKNKSSEEDKVWLKIFEENNNHLQEVNQHLKNDVEMSLNLAVDTEKHLGRTISYLKNKLNDVRNRFRNQALQVKSLELEKTDLIEELKFFSYQLKQKENNESNAVEMLKQLALNLDPINQAKLNHIVQYLKEQVL